MSAPIAWDDIKAGDRIRRTDVEEFTAEDDDVPCRRISSTYELVERPVALPTVPGIYTDHEGDLWQFNGVMWWLVGGSGARVLPGHIVDPALPFTLLRPVAEVAAEVLAEVRKSMNGRTAFLANIDALDTKWATK